MKQYTPTAPNAWHISFDSLADMRAIVEADWYAGPNRELNENYKRHIRSTGWTNGYNAETILDAIASPPADLVADVQSMAEAIRHALPDPLRPRRRQRHHRDIGFALDPVGVAMRNPASWTDIYRASEPKPVIRIGCNPSVHSGRSAEELRWRGAAIAAVADLFTQRGRSVEVSMFRVSKELAAYNSRSRHTLSTVLKRADMPLDIGALAFPLADIGFYRAFVLVLDAHIMPEAVCRNGGLTGRATAAERAAYDLFLDSDILDRESAIAAVTKISAQFTTPA